MSGNFSVIDCMHGEELLKVLSLTCQTMEHGHPPPPSHIKFVAAYGDKVWICKWIFLPRQIQIANVNYL